MYASALHVLSPVLTIASALAVQSPFQRLDGMTDEAARSEASRLRGLLSSPHGDPLTFYAVYDAWLAARGGGGGGRGARWCVQRRLDESKLVEMAKLRRQFSDVLEDEALRAIGVRRLENDDGEMSGQRRRRRGGGSAARRKAAEELRRLQRARDAQRGRRVLQLGDGNAHEHVSDGSGSEADDAPARKRHRGGHRARGTDDGLGHIRELDLRANADVHHDRDRTARRHGAHKELVLTADDIALVAVLSGFALYPQVAVPDPLNGRRRASEARFMSRSVPEATIHPGSVYAGAEATITPHHIAMYENVLQTTRTFLVNVTCLPAMPALLLFAQHVHTDASGAFLDTPMTLLELRAHVDNVNLLTCATGDRMLIDGWLLAVFSDRAGRACLGEAAALRSRLHRLLQARLKPMQHAEAMSAPEGAAVWDSEALTSEDGADLSWLESIAGATEDSSPAEAGVLLD